MKFCKAHHVVYDLRAEVDEEWAGNRRHTETCAVFRVDSSYSAVLNHNHPVCICDGFKQIMKIQRQEWIHCLWLRICLLSSLGKESCQSWIYAKHTSKFASMRPRKSW